MVSVIGVAFAEEQFLSELKIFPNSFTGEVWITGAPLTREHAPLLNLEKILKI